MLNPSKIVWQEPQQTAAGDPIPGDRSLEYEVGIAQDPEGEPEPLMVVAAQLREGTEYEAPIADLALGDGEHSIALRSFYKTEPALKSEWSDTVTFEINGSVPAAPLGLSVE